ncbi:MAG TPA: hypothetical protein EYG11_00985 [Candidatus Latescibacteria bacterium]|nr:hypothetical protein [Candidatus Handelsmanbacteria bacterium]HIL07248.1 hypothetical protein [Candidatus Latescibacterota bacterium]
MPRFILLFAFGALVVAGSQVALALGIHPEHLASLRYILISGVGLTVGTAMAATGLMGLAEGYQLTARQLGSLLQSKTYDKALQLVVRSDDQLQSQNRHFWQAYCSIGLSLSLFLAGLLSISILLGESSFFVYMAGLSAGVGILGVIGAIWGIQGLRCARQCQKIAESDSTLLTAQPDYIAEAPRPTAKAPAKISWSSNHKRSSSYSRALAKRPPVASR